MKFSLPLRFIFFLLLLCGLVHAQNISGIINIYTPVTAISCSQVTVASSAGFAAGDRVLIIQMQGATMDVTNNGSFGNVNSYGDAGHFEFATISSINGTTINLQFSLIKTYSPANGRVQLIRVPQYTNPNISSAVTCMSWNGTVGGVLVFESSGTVNFSADINVTGTGFRGGTTCTNPDGGCGLGYADYYYAVSSGFGSQKGEGLAPFQTGMDGGRGAWSCGGGGGNKHNSGGAGGGNYSQGGEGGKQANFCPSVPVGGVGGYALDYSSGDRVFMGGGGGNSDNNNSVGTHGSNGGGIVIIRAPSIAGNNHSILANGDNVGVIPNSIGDGAGGGGAGGSVLLDVGSFSSPLSIVANGGDGGDQNTTYSSCFGPGGGGGTGLAWFSQSSTPANANVTTNPGAAGIDLNVNSSCYNQSYGATAGATASALVYNLILPEGNQQGLSLGNDSTFCNGTILLDAGNPGATYLWSTGASSQTISVNAAGTYWVTVNNGSCTATDTIRYTANGLTIDLGPDTTICQSSYTINAAQNNATYSWSTGETSPSIVVSGSGNYSVSVTVNGCSGTDNVMVSFQQSGPVDTINYPNVFTPNNDLVNDLFQPVVPTSMNIDLQIYDRWGKLVYRSNAINASWDARNSSGTEVSDGVYYWIAVYETGCAEKTAQHAKGFVSVFRK